MYIEKLIQYFDDKDMFSQKDIELLKISTQEKCLMKDQIMQRHENECKSVPFIVSGQIRLFTVSETGREMNIYRVKEGELCLIAALCILTKKPYEFMVSAETNTELMLISSAAFRELMNTNQKFNRYILSLTADKLIESLSLHEKVHLTGINEKLTNYLYENADNQNIIRKTHEEIARDLGTSRVVVSRELSKLRNEGMITTGRNYIELLN